MFLRKTLVVNGELRKGAIPIVTTPPWVDSWFILASFSENGLRWAWHHIDGNCCGKILGTLKIASDFRKPLLHGVVRSINLLRLPGEEHHACVSRLISILAENTLTAISNQTNTT
jgi:hypothetical protein